MKRLTTSVISRMKKILETSLIGGWVKALNKDVVETMEGNRELKGFQLIARMSKRRTDHNLYVSEKRDINALRIEINESLCNFLEERMKIDDQLIDFTQPFIDLDPATDL